MKRRQRKKRKRNGLPHGRYYEMLETIQDYGDRHNIPFPALMLSILVPWARRRKLIIPPSATASLDD